MTNHLISDVQIGYLLRHGKLLLDQKEMLQSLPMVDNTQASEPRAWEISYKNPETGDQKTIVFMHNAIGDFRMFDPDATSDPLYKVISPQALTQPAGSEAAEFAAWLVDNKEKEIVYEESLIGWLADWIKHRSEAK